MSKQEEMAAVRDELLTNLGMAEGSSPKPEDREDPPEGEEQGEEEETEGGESPDPEVSEVKSITDLAKLIGAEPEALYGLEFTLSGGETLKLGEVKDKLQDLTREAETLRSSQLALAQERQSLLSGLRAHQETVDQFSSVIGEARLAMKTAEADYARIDWARLDRDNPGLSANEKQKLLAQYAAAEERATKGEQQRDAYYRHHEQQARAWHDQQTVNLSEDRGGIPSWKDPAIVQAEAPKIVEWALKLGFTQEEIGSAWDYRYRRVLRDAWRWNENQAKAKTLDPKQLKPLSGGRTFSRANAQNAKEAELVKRARETRNPQDKILAARAVLTNAFAKRK